MLSTRRTILQLALGAPLAAQQNVIPGGARPAGEAPAEPPPINNPKFVPAAEAQIPAEAFVLGVDLDNVQRAYSLNLLAAYQAVNDSTGPTSFAAVWCPAANAAAVYGRVYDGQTFDLHVSRTLTQGSPVVNAQPGGPRWSMMSGLSLPGGPDANPLDHLAVGEKVPWGEWRARFPQSQVLSVDGAQHKAASGWEDYFQSKNGLQQLEARDTRLKTKDSVFGFTSRGQYYAVAHDAMDGGNRFKVHGIGEVLLFRSKRDELQRGTAAFRSGSGFRKRSGYWTEEATGTILLPEIRDFTGSVVERLTGFDTFWYTWSLANPTTELLK